MNFQLHKNYTNETIFKKQEILFQIITVRDIGEIKRFHIKVQIGIIDICIKLKMTITEKNISKLE